MTDELKKEVLLVDDEAGIRKVLGISLEDNGYRVFTAEDAVLALETYKKHAPPIVMTDIKMPGMDGLEVLRKIRESGQEAEVIVITGHGDMDTSIAALQLGASDYITKPVRDAALTLALDRARDKLAIAPACRNTPTIWNRL